MMPKFVKALPLALLLTCLLSAVEARADAVVITSGTASVGSTLGGSFSFSGGNASFSGGVNWGTNSCLPCRAGQTISIHSFTPGLDLRGGLATVNGVTYPSVNY